MKATLTLLLAAALMTMFVVSAKEKIKIKDIMQGTFEIKDIIDIEELIEQDPEEQQFGVNKKPTAIPKNRAQLPPGLNEANTGKPNEGAAEQTANAFQPQPEPSGIAAAKAQPEPEPKQAVAKGQSEDKPAVAQPGENGQGKKPFPPGRPNAE